MKKLLKSFCTLVAMMLLSVVCVSLSSCDKHNCGSSEYETADSVWFTEMYSSTVNPTFTNPSEMLIYHQQTVSNHIEDSVFRSISEPLLYQLCLVVSKQLPCISKTSIVDEYLEHKSVYDNLQLPDAFPDVSGCDLTKVPSSNAKAYSEHDSITNID